MKSCAGEEPGGLVRAHALDEPVDELDIGRRQRRIALPRARAAGRRLGPPSTTFQPARRKAPRSATIRSVGVASSVGSSSGSNGSSGSAGGTNRAIGSGRRGSTVGRWLRRQSTTIASSEMSPITTTKPPTTMSRPLSSGIDATYAATTIARRRALRSSRGSGRGSGRGRAGCAGEPGPVRRADRTGRGRAPRRASGSPRGASSGASSLTCMTTRRSDRSIAVAGKRAARASPNRTRSGLGSNLDAPSRCSWTKMPARTGSCASGAFHA